MSRNDARFQPEIGPFGSPGVLPSALPFPVKAPAALLAGLLAALLPLGVITRLKQREPYTAIV